MKKYIENEIGARKRELCDRINQCKSLKELDEWEKVFSYYPILKNNFDWDYEFLLDLIKFKLKRMSNHFHTHNVVENEYYYGDLCDLAIKILDIGYLSDKAENGDIKGIYVNTRNASRFFSEGFLTSMPSDYKKRYFLVDVRIAKAKALFWKFLNHYIELLWD